MKLLALLLLTGCAVQDPARFNQGLDMIYRARQGQGVGPTYMTPTRPLAFYEREYSQGFNKICFYNRLGSPEAITIPNTSLCPQTLP